MENKKLIIIKGTSGSGKSSLAEFLCSHLAFDSGKAVYYEADNWMVDGDGKYKFDASKLHFCHSRCQYHVEQSMLFEEPVIILSNTSTNARDVRPYLFLAGKYNYQVISLVLEKYHSNKDIHGLNEETLARQEANLKQSLKLR